MDPSVAAIKREFPAWRVWCPFGHWWYAQREIARTSPAVVLRDENLTELRAQVASWERLHDGGRMPG